MKREGKEEEEEKDTGEDERVGAEDEEEKLVKEVGVDDEEEKKVGAEAGCWLNAAPAAPPPPTLWLQLMITLTIGYDQEEGGWWSGTRNNVY